MSRGIVPALANPGKILFSRLPDQLAIDLLGQFFVNFLHCCGFLLLMPDEHGILPRGFACIHTMICSELS
jgi:hypothetical protein